MSNHDVPAGVGVFHGDEDENGCALSTPGPVGTVDVGFTTGIGPIDVASLHELNAALPAPNTAMSDAVTTTARVTLIRTSLSLRPGGG